MDDGCISCKVHPMQPGTNGLLMFLGMLVLDMAEGGLCEYDKQW